MNGIHVMRLSNIHQRLGHWRDDLMLSDKYISPSACPTCVTGPVKSILLATIGAILETMEMTSAPSVSAEARHFLLQFGGCRYAFISKYASMMRVCNRANIKHANMFISMQVCKYASIQVYLSPNMQVCKSSVSMQICLSPCKYASMQVCLSPHMQVCKSSVSMLSPNVHVCDYASMFISKYVCK